MNAAEGSDHVAYCGGTGVRNSGRSVRALSVVSGGTEGSWAVASGDGVGGCRSRVRWRSSNSSAATLCRRFSVSRTARPARMNDAMGKMTTPPTSTKTIRTIKPSMIHLQPRIYGRVRSVSTKPKIHQRKFKGAETCCNAARVEESGKLEAWGKLAEGVGFEPTVALRLRLISSQD